MALQSFFFMRSFNNLDFVSMLAKLDNLSSPVAYESETQN